MSTAANQTISQALVLLMATATGIAVAGNYYAQPLLHTIAQELGSSYASTGNIITTAQLSYGLGLVLLVPLADMIEHRRLIVSMMFLTTLGLVVSALSHHLPMLMAGTAIAGFCSVVAQVLVPFASTLSAPEQRGRVIGTVMGGLLLGILLARVVSGAVSTLVDWRMVYWVAAFSMFVTTLLLARYLPRYHNAHASHYGQLLSSLLQLFVKIPELRHRSLLGMFSFALFSMFWTPLAFLLSKPPYEYNDATIGLFGLVGAAGVWAASWAGKMADSGKGHSGLRIGLLVLLFSWVILYFAPNSLTALLVGVLLLDLAVQLVHVGNQSVIYGLQPEIRNRLNAGYMTCYFIGGASGSWLSVVLFQHHGWHGIVAGACVIAGLALLLGWKQR